MDNFKSPERSSPKPDLKQPIFKDLQRRFEATRGIGQDAEDSYDGASNTVIKMIRFLESAFQEFVGGRGMNADMENMRDAVRRADYDTAISEAESYYQSHYLPSHVDAPKTLFEMVLGSEDKST